MCVCTGHFIDKCVPSYPSPGSSLAAAWAQDPWKKKGKCTTAMEKEGKVHISVFPMSVLFFGTFILHNLADNAETAKKKGPSVKENRESRTAPGRQSRPLRARAPQGLPASRPSRCPGKPAAGESSGGGSEPAKAENPLLGAGLGQQEQLLRPGRGSRRRAEAARPSRLPSASRDVAKGPPRAGSGRRRLLRAATRGDARPPRRGGRPPPQGDSRRPGGGCWARCGAGAESRRGPRTATPLSATRGARPASPRAWECGARGRGATRRPPWGGECGEDRGGQSQPGASASKVP